MFHYLVLILAISFLVFLYARRKASISRANRYKAGYTNKALDEYLEMADMPTTTSTKLFKQLVSAAAILMERQQEIELEKLRLYPLFVDRMISYDLWNSLETAEEELGFERLSIEAEATRFKEFGKVFEQAARLLGPPKGHQSKTANKKESTGRADSLRKHLYERIVLKESACVPEK
jgi:Preprotein translocase subunit Sec66